ncbi:phage head spike fiber domain-containing protein [Pseudoduganella sp. R-43]|uniref:phage head spike fiber domain-containing protein n=1 Tax=Pseudoduganella sp. R-43 TaxID=3404063 RepID=UPI003CF9ED29
MNNLRIVHDNAVSRAALAASSTAGVLVAGNLQVDDKSSVWRATGTTGRLTATWAAAESIAAVALPFCNLSPSATMRVRLSNEGGTTNLLGHPSNMDRSPWQSGNTAIIPNATQAPDGTLTAGAMVRIAPGNHYLRQASTMPAAGSSFTGSVWLKAGTYTGGVKVLLHASGVVLVSQTVQPTAQWTRFSCNGTFPESAIGNVAFNIDPVDDVGVAGEQLYVWGAQVEAGLIATSLAPDATAFTSRASAKWVFDAAGVLNQVGANISANDFDPSTLISKGMSLEAAATNTVRNNTMVGAVPGTPGTNPTNWGLSLPSGLSVAVVGTGVEAGIDFIDYRLFGTPSSGSSGIRFEQSNGVAAASGQSWAASVFVRRVAGSEVNITSIRANLYGLASGGAGTVDSFAGANLIGMLGGSSLAAVRAVATGTLTDATTANVRPQLLIGHAAGAPIDITLRIGLPQLEQGRAASSPIKTSGATVTRAADLSVSPPGVRPAGYIDSWQSYDYDSGFVPACPAPAVKLRGWSAAQAASAYAYGGGAYARHWLPSAVQSLGLAVDIVDPANLQGYIEATCLVAGPYWSPVYNASKAPVTNVDTTELYRTGAGCQGADAGYTYRTLPIDLEFMPAADRAAFVNIIRNSRAYPVLISVFPGWDDLALERDNMIYGRRSKDSSVAVQYALAYSTTIEFEEI